MSGETSSSAWYNHYGRKYLYRLVILLGFRFNRLNLLTRRRPSAPLFIINAGKHSVTGPPHRRQEWRRDVRQRFAGYQKGTVPKGSGQGRRVRRGRCPRQFRSRTQINQRPLVVGEVRRVQHLNACIMLAIKRRHGIWTSRVLGIYRRVEPKTKMIGLYGTGGLAIWADGLRVL